MKKNATVVLLLSIALIVGGCSKVRNVKTSKSVLVTNISGKTSADTLYWKTPADGVNKISIKDSKFNIKMPNTLSKYTMKLSAHKDFKSSKAVDVTGVKSLIGYSKFSNKVNSFDYDDYIPASLAATTIPTEATQGLSTLYKSEGGNVILRGTVDDDKLVGLTLTSLLMNDLSKEEVSDTTDMLAVVVESLGSDYKVVFKGFNKAFKGTGQKISVKSNGITYDFYAEKATVFTAKIHK